MKYTKELTKSQRTIKNVFALDEVPREAFLLGLAGLLPYAATSLTTVYLAWDINHADLTGNGFLLSGATAQQLLDYIEPLQIGYGAVVSPPPSSRPSIPRHRRET